MKAKKDDVDWWDKPISTADAAAMLGISAARLRQLSASGLVEKTGHGMTTPALAARGACAFWENKASEKTKTASDSRVRDARAREIEMRNDERMRTLIPIDDATAALDYLVGVVRSRMNSIPARVTRDIELRRKIEGEINAAQAKIAEALGKAADAARKGAELPNPG